MPVKPKIKTLTNSSVDVLNAIRNNASNNYRDYVPQATADSDSIREIGAIIMDYPNLQNEFLSALVNRVGRVLITSKEYDNPLAVFKKGMLEFGESIEEIFVNIAKPFQFDPSVAEQTVFRREIPDVRSTFHVLNFQKFYKVTVQNDQLRQAFLSWDGITDLIAKIVESLHTAANYDEFITMKYLIARNILNGRFYPVEIPEVDTSNMKGIVSTIKGVSNKLEFLSSKYNVSGVSTKTDKKDQYLLVNADFDSVMDVEVLASAFNMNKAEFMGQRLLVDGFGDLDNDRLSVLFGDDPTYVEITSEEREALNVIPAVLVDKDWFMIFDNYQNFTEQYNGEGLYWNYWYHVWKTFSVSPFANNVIFVPEVQSVDSITLLPTSVDVVAGTPQTIGFTANVNTSGFAPKTVKWSIFPDTVPGISVNDVGVVTITDELPADVGSESLYVNATSVFDDSVVGTASINVVEE